MIARVRLWGRTIGAASWDEARAIASFEYDPRFADSGIQISPLVMPLGREIHSFPNLAPATFHGLPGLLADSLPDRFGHAVIDEWLASQGRTADSFSPVERLCYVGTRGMGALEFEPAIGPRAKKASPVDIDAMVKLASEILTKRQRFKVSLADSAALGDLLRVGTSAGGARAKAVIAWNPATNEVRSGQVNAGPGFEYWLLKFDGVSGNKDRELEHPKGYGAIEFAYHLMAKAAGLHVPDARLHEEHGRRHFMSKRFDRLADGKKIHMQSLGALAHFDYNAPGAHSYEEAILVTRRLGLPMEEVEEQFRRMAFNIVARNQDDHVKNVAFLMDKEGRWSLAPAYDVTYSYNPTSAWVSSHQMTLNGRRDGFTLGDFRACGKTASMKRGRAEAIVAETAAVVRRWPEFAEQADVDAAWRKEIRKNLRLQLA